MNADDHNPPYFHDEYAGKHAIIDFMDYYPLVTQVIPHEDYTVDVSFSDGKTVTVNMLPQIVAGKQKNNLFARIADINDFMGRCTIITDTLAWDIGGKKDAWNMH